MTAQCCIECDTIEDNSAKKALQLKQFCDGMAVALLRVQAFITFNQVQARIANMRAKVFITIVAAILLIIVAAFQTRAKAPAREIVLPDIVIKQ